MPRAVPPTQGAPSDPALERAVASEQAKAGQAARAAVAAGPGQATPARVPGRAPAFAPIPLPAPLVAFAEAIATTTDGLEPDPAVVGLPAFRVPRARLLEVGGRWLRDLGLDYLTCLTGVDYPGDIEVIYHLFCSAHPELGAVLKVRAPKGDAEPSRTVLVHRDPWLPSVTRLWPGAEWHEREVFDLLGVWFDDHPDLRPILMPEGFSAGYPLRKDYVDRREQRERKVRVR